MKTGKRTLGNGFIMYLVLVALGLTATGLFFLTSMSNGITAQSRAHYLHACERNLTASGIAWVRYHRKDLKEKLAAGPVTLDIEELDIPQGILQIQSSEKAPAPPVILRITCQKGRQTIRREIPVSSSGSNSE